MICHNHQIDSKNIRKNEDTSRTMRDWRTSQSNFLKANWVQKCTYSARFYDLKCTSLNKCAKVEWTFKCHLSSERVTYNSRILDFFWQIVIIGVPKLRKWNANFHIIWQRKQNQKNPLIVCDPLWEWTTHNVCIFVILFIPKLLTDWYLSANIKY